jgi:hypothetical protein
MISVLHTNSIRSVYHFSHSHRMLREYQELYDHSETRWNNVKTRWQESVLDNTCCFMSCWITISMIFGFVMILSLCSTNQCVALAIGLLILYGCFFVCCMASIHITNSCSKFKRCLYQFCFRLRRFRNFFEEDEPDITNMQSHLLMVDHSCDPDLELGHFQKKVDAFATESLLKRVKTNLIKAEKWNQKAEQQVPSILNEVLGHSLTCVFPLIIEYSII